VFIVELIIYYIIKDFAYPFRARPTSFVTVRLYWHFKAALNANCRFVERSNVTFLAI
jgi:hypothetical protein